MTYRMTSTANLVSQWNTTYGTQTARTNIYDNIASGGSITTSAPLVDFDQMQELQRQIAQARKRRETPPFHWWIPDQSGKVCRVCDPDNIYRGAPAEHMPIIYEDPELDDWQRRLGG